MNKGGIVVLIAAAVVFAGLGFVFGQVIQQANSVPRTLVTEDYVKQLVGMSMAEMQEKIDDLEMRLLGNTAPPTDSQTPTDPLDPIVTPPNTPVTPTGPTSVKIKADSVNVRADASSTAARVGGVTINTVLTYLGQKNDSDDKAWYQVRMADGKEGWVASWLCYAPE